MPAPKLDQRDGSGTTTELVLSTNLEYITLTGSVDTTTVSLQISVNSGSFSSDPSLVKLDGFNFTIPNLDSYPDGLGLDLGRNVIKIRTINLLGSVSPTSTAVITRVESLDDIDFQIPSGVKVRRNRDSVSILIAKPELIDPVPGPTTGLVFRGYNIYASQTPGGVTGYFRINAKPISEISLTFEDNFELVSGSTVFEPFSNNLRLHVAQEDQFDKVQVIHINRSIPIFDYTEQLKFSYRVEETKKTDFMVFEHNRSGGINITNSDQWVDADASESLYYVVSGLYYDPDTGSEFETPYSQEVLGKPLVIDTSFRDLPGRTQLQVIISYVEAIQRVNEEVALIPGSTTRDVSIDPFASEIERVWFVLDFVHRSQSFLTLIQIDDANGDGVSDPVVSSAYKSALKAALGFSTNTATQQLIDTQFDKLAGNFNKVRLPGRSSIGQAVFYTNTKPSSDATVPSGTIVPAQTDAGTVQFTVGGTYVLPVTDAEAYYNFDTKRYEIVVDIVANRIGSVGNVPAGAIKSSASVGGLSVINTESTTFGNDRESNYDLALRSQLGFSIDSGTEGGYAQTSAEQPNVIKFKIVKSGDPLMMRDYDEVRGKHIGGKVDVWVQGLKERTRTETFAFTFKILRDVTCQVLDATNLTFRVISSQVTVDTPITEILDNPSQGLGVRNASKGQDYDLSGWTLVDFQTFKLDPAMQSFITASADVITVDFRFRSVNKFVMSLQPVRRVVSVAGQASGPLARAGYSLYKTEDPLLEGESTLAKDYVEINQIGGIPLGDVITVTDEVHILVGFFENKLFSVGANTATIRVFNQSRTVEYSGPSTATPDFDIIEGTATSPAKIVRTSNSTIQNGEIISVDYDHDENFEVTYVINDVLQQFQRTLNIRRHTTADVLAKQAIVNSVDIETTLQLKYGAKKDVVDPKVRTNVSKEFNSRLIGQGIAQSDLINEVDSTEGVDFQVLPLARMGYADGSKKLREHVAFSSTRLPVLDIGANRVFILNSPLRYYTVDQGGPAIVHKGVFQDGLIMTMAPSIVDLGYLSKGCYIIGYTGAWISGYSDDATIMAETGLVSVSDIASERVRRTANRVLLSLQGPVDDPLDHAYAVSYNIYNDRGPHDIQAADVEFIDLGAFVITSREAG